MNCQTMSGKWLVSCLFLVSGLSACLFNQNALAQEGQGKYVTQGAVRLSRLIDKSNADGFKLDDNQFSIGGGWIKQGTKTWVSLYSLNLARGRQFRFLAAGDNDAKDVDLQILNAKGKVVAADTSTSAEAVVTFQPTVTGRYTVRLRLYSSQQNYPCLCLGAVLSK